MEVAGLGSFTLPPRLMFCHFDTTPYHAFDNLAYAIRDIPEKNNIALPENVLEKPPLAHATFLRMKKAQDSRPLKKLAELHHQKWEFKKGDKIQPASLSFQADQISLIQSTLTENGPTYTTIKDYRLT
jgi:2'-5' RNA ligase